MKPTVWPVLLMGALALAGCHKRSAPPPPEPENVQQPAPPPPPPAPKPEPPKPAPKPVVAVPPDTTKVSEDEQMREDAEATGMTSRVNRSSSSGDTSNSQ